MSARPTIKTSDLVAGDRIRVVLPRVLGGHVLQATNLRDSFDMTVTELLRMPGRVAGCPWRITVQGATGRKFYGYFAGSNTHMYERLAPR